MNIDTTPDPDEIVQAEEHYDPTRPINVLVCGPVATRELPAKAPGYKTEQGVGATVALKLLPFEPRRKAGLVMAISQDVWLSSSQAGAMAAAAGAIRIPALVPWPIDHMEEVWAMAVAGTTDISVQSSYWSE